MDQMIMLNATLETTAGPPRAALPAPPLVLVDGRLEPALWVRSLRMDGPLDVREARLGIRRDARGGDPFELARIDHLRTARVTLLQPIALAGGDSRLLVLLDGRIDGDERRLDARADRIDLRAACRWTIALQRPVAPEDLRFASPAAATVEAVLDRLDAVGRLNVSAVMLSAAERRRVVSRTALAGRGRTIGSVLEAILREHGLVIQREVAWDGAHAVEHRAVRPARTGRPLRIAAASLRAAVAAHRPVRFTAEARGQVVESTFALVGGWDPADEALDDAAYGKSSSADFDAVANVFRLWVLNEDGRYSPGAPGFDLTALFDEGRPIPPRPLAFGLSLTRDGAGRSVGIVIEASTDSGATWFRWPGAARTLRDRAGVYLDDDALPGAFLAAAKAGEARIRVTAALRSPLPIRAVRWRGNPFAGPFRSQRFDLGDAFAHRRVAPTSKHAEPVAAGERHADTADERDALAAWLAEVTEATPPAGGARTTVEAPALLLALRIGDLMDTTGGVAASAAMTRITHDWTTARTTLESA